MPLMTRYVLFELIKVFGITLTAMTLFMMMVGVAQEAIRQGLGPSPIVQMLPYVLPNALRFAVPGTILFAACSVYGRMAADNEIVALKSIGASPMVVVAPGLVLAFLVSLSAVWLNDVAVSWGRRGIHRVVLQSVEQIVYGVLRTQKSYSTDRLSISVLDVRDRTLVQPTLSIHPTPDAPAVTMTAQKAQLRLNEARDAKVLVLDDSEVDWGDNLSGVIPGRIEHAIPLAFASRRGELGGGPSERPLRLIPDEIASQKAEIERLEQQMAALAAYQLMAGDFPGACDLEAWQQQHAKLTSAQQHLFRLQTEPWRRWASGFSCLCFVMIGVPVAVWLRQSEFIASFFICFLPILVVYYPLLAVSVDWAKDGNLPPQSVWIGNVLLALAGAWLLRRVERY
jgi:lipopolysaccharide export system permease protein